ncbi:uncharacterized protein HMPREF1541_08107 [Cyphellophora europaea CBS 101466]|uniref:chitinase n=1 Tax=Cyphellophora europaea (strain CBS 101466) TaxID=1220924 RepID=W2RKU8_CYPE1|nr:uncharacterized protein HMPREF1541_08107 [Cyphellophora europaea CBS 101466]ETN37117.1 hypothetical protein HMPREF1541_08107 [Cyphellophora europaea CBS 101466]
MTPSRSQMLTQLALAALLNTVAMGAPISRSEASAAGSTNVSLATAPSRPLQPTIPTHNLTRSTNHTEFLNGGYWPDWEEDIADVCLDVGTLSHVNYAFAQVLDDGSISIANPDGLWRWMQRKGTHPDLKVSLAVGGGTAMATEAFAAMASDPTKLAFFITSIQAAVEGYGLDGIDIDWEYPQTTEQGQQLLTLLQMLRQAMPRPFHISAAVPTGDWALQYIPLAEIAEVIDLLNLMAYDFVGATFANTFVTGHQAKLYSAGAGGASGNAAVEYIESQGFPANKILLGVPLYGRVFDGANWLNEKFSGTSGDSEYLVKDLPRPGMQEFYDSDAVAVFAVGDGQFITYDNAQSVSEKAKYVRTRGLAGLFFWQLTADRCRDGSLVRAGYEGLKGFHR